MKTLFLLQALAVAAASSATAFSQDTDPPGSGSGATTIYRQLMPDGRVVYSDKAVKGGKVDHTILVEPPIKGNSWTTETGTRPVIAPEHERTPVRQVASVPKLGKKKSLDDATSDVIRAEMLLEDAKRRKEASVEPLPGERSGTVSAGSRLNENYEARQKSLARDVTDAEAALKRAIEDRDRLR